MKKKLIGFILCGLILAMAAGCSDTPTQVGQINNSSMESADVTSDREDKDNSDDFTAEKDQLSQTADSASSESQSEIPAEKKEESAVPPVTNTDKTEKDSSSSNSTAESNPTISEQTNSETSNPPETSVTDKPDNSSGESQSPPKEPEPEESQEPQTPSYTQADYDRIISETITYAESYKAKGFTFEWKESMQFGWDVGYMGTPRIERDGTDGVIKTLKHHIDLIVQTSSDPANGITTDWMTYKVVQITIDGDIAFAVIYGG